MADTKANKASNIKSSTKKASAKSSTKKTTTHKKKPTNKNVDYYEIKLLILLAFTILSVFSLHTELIGFVGRFVKSLYFGLFSYAGYILPYIILVGGFYKLNNRLILYRKKTIVGLLILFFSIILVVNIFNFEFLNTNFILSETKLLKINALIDSYNYGRELQGSGLIGNPIGKLLIGLVNIAGLYIVVGTLWLISFVLITNIKVTEVVTNLISSSKQNFIENAEIKKKANEEYIKQSEALEAKRIKEEEKIKKMHEKKAVISRDEQSNEKLAKALSKVEKKLKANERTNVRKIEEYDALFTQSPTRSIVDKILKKSTIPSKDELIEKKRKEQIQILKNKEKEEAFSMFESSGYSFDDQFNETEITGKLPEIFDNHIDCTISKEELSKPITGFGSTADDRIIKTHQEANEEKTVSAVFEKDESSSNVDLYDDIPFEDYKGIEFVKPISSFDAAFKITENKNKASLENVKTGDEIFEYGDPMSPEQKQDALSFDSIISGKNSPSNISGVENKNVDVAVVNNTPQNIMLELENYIIPEISILKKNNTLNKENKGAALEKARLLEEILDNFNIDAKVIQISKGPAITRYEIQLKPGTKMSKIVGLSDDIALNLATQQVRIAAVPGKAAVGIEIPNDSTALVTLREVIETEEFRSQEAKLSVGLGKNIAGIPIMADLAKMPHLLIAGATGSGKSVCVNTIITSILLNSKPDEVKFLMIDPKVVELNIYNGIPHLILPVVTDPKKASIVLNWAVEEMGRRYNEFAENGSRDITGYNKKVGIDKEKFMPQIVVIIDELADLMMAAPNQVEDAICRLAQMARAAGIHLIVATQRPSVDVITGVIKANIPSRIAFAVSSAIDSRTIIDMGGAEKLLGKGDMLYYPVGSGKPQRIQGAFISDEEVEAVVDAVKNQFEAITYDDSLLDSISDTTESIDDSDDDEYFSRAVRIVVEMEQASISMLQRKFKIGYNRAARIVDEMEERGIVGPPMGSKPRLVLINKSELE